MKSTSSLVFRRFREESMKLQVFALVAMMPLCVQAQSVGGGPGTSPCLALAVTPSSRFVETAASTTQKFSATKTQDLYFTLVLSRAALPVSQFELKIYTPKGNLYQSVSVPVANSTGGQSPEPYRQIPSYPHPVKVQGISEVSLRAIKYPSVTSPPFLVGGTSISLNSLFGFWKAEVFLKNGIGGTSAAPVPCITQPFVILQ
jgi:hypothetical protein